GRATRAQEARLAVEDEEALRLVPREVVLRRMPGSREPVRSGGHAHLAEAVALRARREHGPGQVEHGLARLDGVGVLGIHDQAVARGKMAGRGQSTLALDVDETGATRAEWGAVGILAELG